jgi:hypothetical protein
MVVEKKEPIKREASRSVSIFMGTEFYQVMKILMIKSAESNIQSDYATWISILRQVYNMTHHFMSSKKAEVKSAINGCQNALLTRNFNNPVSSRILLEKIFKAEELLYDEIGELLVKTSSDEDDSTPNFKEVWQK